MMWLSFQFGSDSSGKEAGGFQHNYFDPTCSAGHASRVKKVNIQSGLPDDDDVRHFAGAVVVKPPVVAWVVDYAGTIGPDGR